MPPASSHRLRNAFLALGVLAVVAFGISRISFKVDILKSLPSDFDEVRGLGLYLEHFSRPDELIVAITGENPGAVDETAHILSEAMRGRPDLIADVIDHPPWEDEPASLAEIIAFALLNQPPSELAALEAGLEVGSSSLRLEEALGEITFAVSPEIALRRSYDPLNFVSAALGADGASEMISSGASEFVSDDGTFRVLYVRAPGERDRAHYRDLAGWIAEVRALVNDTLARSATDDTLAVRFTGEPAFVTEISSGMERDMKLSGLATMLVVGVVFWLWYRRLQPLAALVAMLLLTFLITLGLAGLAIADITVMNVGFASILIGLSVDYGVLIYQASLRSPGNPTAIRRTCRRGILFAGATTALAFGSLALSSLPGLSELGILVAIGIAVGATVMLSLFATWMGKISRNREPAGADDPVSIPERWFFRPAVANTLSWAVLALVAVSAATLLFSGAPPLDATSQTLRPRISEAYDTLDEISLRLLGNETMGSLLVEGASAKELRDRIASLLPALEEAKGRGEIKRFMLPTAFIPDAGHQSANLAGPAKRLVAARDRLKSELEEAGFAEDAAGLLLGVLDTWEGWQKSALPVMPASRSAHWMLDRMLRIPTAEDGLYYAAGHIVLAPGADVRHLATADGVLLADWNQMMIAVLDRVPAEIFKVLAALVVIVIAMLAVTFRRIQEVLAVLLSIALSLIALLGVMRLLGWSWNFLNLATLLLTFGAGLDYSIHMLLGFQRSGGDVARVQKDTGQALLVCALSTVAGFGSLAWAGNLGLASLGKTCALGLFLNALVAIFLLPKLWLRFGPKR